MNDVDVYTAVKAFVQAYALPAMEPASVFQGWQNRAALPPGTNEYAVISILSDSCHGTRVETFTADDPNIEVPGNLTVKELIKVAVQVDICAESDVARQRARHLATMTRSSLGVQFFNAYGISALYADDVRELSFVDDARQFVRRYVTTLYLSYWSGVSLGIDYFSNAKLTRFENVDMHHTDDAHPHILCRIRSRMAKNAVFASSRCAAAAIPGGKHNRP